MVELKRRLAVVTSNARPVTMSASPVSIDYGRASTRCKTALNNCPPI